MKWIAIFLLIIYSIPLNLQAEESKITILIANKNIKKDSLIYPEDLDYQIIEHKQFNSNMITQTKELEGMVAKRNIFRQTPILKTHLQSEYIVKKNDSVSIVYKNNHIQIETQGNALENGISGATIKIQNNKTKKIIYGKVIDKHTVYLQ